MKKSMEKIKAQRLKWVKRNIRMIERKTLKGNYKDRSHRYKKEKRTAFKRMYQKQEAIEKENIASHKNVKVAMDVT